MLRKLITSLLLLTSQIVIALPYDSYLNWVRKNDKFIGPIGESPKGEIEILVDPGQIDQARQAQFKRLIAKGWPEDKALKATQVGILSEDSFWIFVRDPVRFPGGALGLYNRLIWRNQLSDERIGAIVLPYTAEGKVGLCLSFRHATRSWLLELPRGGKMENEPILMCAKRELREEAGWVASDWTHLANFYPDSGVMGGEVCLYAAKLQKMREQEIDDSEAIESGLVFLNIEEIEKAYHDGGLWLEIRGHKQWVGLHDSALGCGLWLCKDLLAK